MGFDIHDGVWEITSAHGGAGAYPLAGTPAGEPSALHTFGAVFGDGDQMYYRAWRSGEGEEEGVGQYNAASNEIERIRPIKSTNGNAALDWGAGGVTNVICVLGTGVLRSLVDPTTGTGLRVRTASETYAHRTIQGGTGITVTAGDGVAADPQIAVMPFTYAPYSVPGLAGGSDGRVVRISAADTCVLADRTHTVDQLAYLLFRAGGLYVPPGREIGSSGRTPGAPQYLSTAGQMTEVEPDLAANPTWCKVVLGVALSATRVLFDPRPPIRGS